MVQTINTINKVIKEEGIGSLLNKSLNYLKQITTMPYYLIKCKYKKQLPIDKSIDMAYNSVAGILTPAQVRSEITSLLYMISDMRPKRIMELGTGKGGNLFLLCNAAPTDAEIIALDMRGGPHGAGYPPWKIPLLKSFKLKEQELTLVMADSHKTETQDKIAALLDGGFLDVLFIDGDHSYDGVKKDFELYSPFVRPGGIIIFHDIVPHIKDPTCKVNIFWNELKQQYKYIEFIENINQDWAGIGIIEQK